MEPAASQENKIAEPPLSKIKTQRQSSTVATARGSRVGMIINPVFLPPEYMVFLKEPSPSMEVSMLLSSYKYLECGFPLAQTKVNMFSLHTTFPFAP